MIKSKLHILFLTAAAWVMACGVVSCADTEGSEALVEAALGAVERQGQEAAMSAACAALTSGVVSGATTGGDADVDAAVEADMPGSGGDPRHDRLMAILTHRDTIRSLNPYEARYDSMPPGGIKMKINGLGGTLGRVFNDSNKFHIAVAEANGIEPLHSLRQVWQQAGRLERLQTCEAYYLDDMTHSVPYLVPKAHTLLKDIGLAFRDSLRSRGGGYYRVKVTSVLRTPALVKRLRRRNRNAVDTSAHLYATTFDISYLKFICDTPSIPRTQEDMKNLLGEVVEDMRRHGRCYVKYERKQACFHITAR